MSAGDAWYSATCQHFLGQETDEVVSVLLKTANLEAWEVQPEQQEEWGESIKLLRNAPGVKQLRGALRAPELADFTDVVLEYNFRRRGLRIDCVLLAPGLIVVLEFKRTKLDAAAREQVSSYATSLMEFHEQTQLSVNEGAIVVPVLSLTGGSLKGGMRVEGSFLSEPWQSIVRRPFECDRETLKDALRAALELRRELPTIDRASWETSQFAPSSTILDAAISLYGQHDVSAIKEHDVPVQKIEDCTSSVVNHIQQAEVSGTNRIILVSGAPGAGKTLVGLKLAFHEQLRGETVFVTGNAPLVKVLNKALSKSYRANKKAASSIVAAGYAKEQVRKVIDNADFKIVAAHQFLGKRGSDTGSAKERVVIFDEAQRTYEEGKVVLREKLPKHEAELVLESLENSCDSGAVVVALLGHNQAINRGERGAVAWFEAAEAKGWDISVADETLELAELAELGEYAAAPNRHRLEVGHLSHSMRFYRNEGIELWADAVLRGATAEAKSLAEKLRDEGHPFRLTRTLQHAKTWSWGLRKGDERCGMVASGQAKRLAAEGLFPNFKPTIEDWMLAPDGDCRSSNMLETVQNQYQVQGLEMDYVILCWGADLRREGDEWRSYKLSGASWKKDSALEVAKNGYRVLLTRARRDMVIFVPMGDQRDEDPTRRPEFYQGVADYLMACGAVELS